MKYKLINQKTKEEHFCDKIAIDSFDYYVGNKCNDLGGWHIDKEFEILSNVSRFNVVTEMREVIATNNPNIDVPKVKEMSDYLAKQLNKQSFDDYGYPKWDEGKLFHRQMGFIDGYNKSQETHPFTEEDMIEFYKWVNQPHLEDNKQPSAVYVKNIDMWWYNHKKYTSKELLKLWKEQRPKIVYYE